MKVQRFVLKSVLSTAWVHVSGFPMIFLSFAVFGNHDHVKPSILAIPDANLKPKHTYTSIHTIEIQEVNFKYCGILWPITTQARNLSTQKKSWPINASLTAIWIQSGKVAKVSLIKLFGIWLSFSWKAVNMCPSNTPYPSQLTDPVIFLGQRNTRRNGHHLWGDGSTAGTTEGRLGLKEGHLPCN